MHYIMPIKVLILTVALLVLSLPLLLLLLKQRLNAIKKLNYDESQEVRMVAAIAVSKKHLNKILFLIKVSTGFPVIYILLRGLDLIVSTKNKIELGDIIVIYLICVIAWVFAFVNILAKYSSLIELELMRTSIGKMGGFKG